MRVLLSLAAAAALGLTIGVSAPVEAAKKPMNKQCMATDLAGKKQTFKCSATEKCCWDAVLQKGNCVAATSVCL